MAVLCFMHMHCASHVSAKYTWPYLAVSWEAVLGIAQMASLILLPAQLTRDEGGQALLQRVIVWRMYLQQVAAPEAQLQARRGTQALQLPLHHALLLFRLHKFSAWLLTLLLLQPAMKQINNALDS